MHETEEARDNCPVATMAATHLTPPLDLSPFSAAGVRPRPQLFFTSTTSDRVAARYLCNKRPVPCRAVRPCLGKAWEDL